MASQAEAQCYGQPEPLLVHLPRGSQGLQGDLITQRDTL